MSMNTQFNDFNFSENQGKLNLAVPLRRFSVGDVNSSGEGISRFKALQSAVVIEDSHRIQTLQRERFLVPYHLVADRIASRNIDEVIITPTQFRTNVRSHWNMVTPQSTYVISSHGKKEFAFIDEALKELLEMSDYEVSLKLEEKKNDHAFPLVKSTKRFNTARLKPALPEAVVAEIARSQNIWPVYNDRWTGDRFLVSYNVVSDVLNKEGLALSLVNFTDFKNRPRDFWFPEEGHVGAALRFGNKKTDEPLLAFITGDAVKWLNEAALKLKETEPDFDINMTAQSADVLVYKTLSEARNKRQRRSPKAAIEKKDSSHVFDASDEVISSSENREFVETWLNSLKPKVRQAMILSLGIKTQALSVAGIVEAMGVSIASVSNYRKQAYEFLNMLAEGAGKQELADALIRRVQRKDTASKQILNIEIADAQKVSQTDSKVTQKKNRDEELGNSNLGAVNEDDENVELTALFSGMSNASLETLIRGITEERKPKEQLSAITADASDEVISSSENREFVETWLNSLKPKVRQAMILSLGIKTQALSVAGIVEAMGVSIASVSNYRKQAYEFLNMLAEGAGKQELADALIRRVQRKDTASKQILNIEIVDAQKVTATIKKKDSSSLVDGSTEVISSSENREFIEGWLNKLTEAAQLEGRSEIASAISTLVRDQYRAVNENTVSADLAVNKEKTTRPKVTASENLKKTKVKKPSVEIGADTSINPDSLFSPLIPEGKKLSYIEMDAKYKAYRDNPNTVNLNDLFLGCVPTIRSIIFASSKKATFLRRDAESNVNEKFTEILERYDPTQGASFATYLGHRVRGITLDLIRSSVKEQVGASRSQGRRARHIGEITGIIGIDSSDRKIAEYIQSNEDYSTATCWMTSGKSDSIDKIMKKIRDAKEHTQNTFSLDQSSSTEGDDASKLLDTIEDEVSISVEMLIDEASFEQDFRKAISELPEREKFVVKQSIEEDLNLREIGELLGVSESRVCQIYGQAATRLRGKLDLPEGFLGRDESVHVYEGEGADECVSSSDFFGSVGNDVSFHQMVTDVSPLFEKLQQEFSTDRNAPSVYRSSLVKEVSEVFDSVVTKAIELDTDESYATLDSFKGKYSDGIHVLREYNVN